MTSFHALVLCLTLAQSSWEKPDDFASAAEAEKAEKAEECWGEGRREKAGTGGQAGSNSTCPLGALGAWALFQGG